MAPRPTIKDVAREANVSHATVSYILNNNWHASRISEETKARVWNAVHKLGYKFNPIGRDLKRGYTNRVTVLVVTWNLAISHAATAMAISRAAADQEFEVTVHVADSDHDAEAFLHRRMLHNTGGVLVLWDSPAMQDSFLVQLASEGLPVVDLLPGSPKGISQVTTDREEAGFRIASYLLGLGHRHIGFIGDFTSRAKTSTSKLAGCRRALEQAGLEVAAGDVENVAEFGFDAGYQALPLLLKRRPETTAVFCINDPMAIGAIAAARECGRACPRDISVVGYGAFPESAYWQPPITTFALSPDKVASDALDMIIRQRRQPQHQPEVVLVPGELIIRASTAPAPLASSPASH